MASERPPHTKPFVVNNDDFTGATIREKYQADPNYKRAREMANFCNTYAQSYNHIVL
jgi:hypothetical protein